VPLSLWLDHFLRDGRDGRWLDPLEGVANSGHELVGFRQALLEGGFYPSPSNSGRPLGLRVLIGKGKALVDSLDALSPRVMLPLKQGLSRSVAFERGEGDI
jgi:hypothetical protein